jgi:uncharacterized paraquat-inducible protein A
MTFQSGQFGEIHHEPTAGILASPMYCRLPQCDCSSYEPRINAHEESSCETCGHELEDHG